VVSLGREGASNCCSLQAREKVSWRVTKNNKTTDHWPFEWRVEWEKTTAEKEPFLDFTTNSSHIQNEKIEKQIIKQMKSKQTNKINSPAAALSEIIKIISRVKFLFTTNRGRRQTKMRGCVRIISEKWEGGNRLFSHCQTVHSLQRMASTIATILKSFLFFYFFIFFYFFFIFFSPASIRLL